jgi:hypothetical protein
MKAEEAKVVRQALDVPAHVVYEFARREENLPQWASGLANGITQRGGDWFADSPMGEVKLTMAPTNEFGVLDHDVELPDGTTVHNAFRVTPCGEAASLLTFVLLRLPGVSQKDFDADQANIEKDLLALKKLLERRLP